MSRRISSSCLSSCSRSLRRLLGLREDSMATHFGQAATTWGVAGATMLTAARAPTAASALALLASRASGLTAEEAAERQAQYGPNVITSVRSPPWFRVLLWAFVHPFNILLLLLATAAGATEDFATFALLCSMVVLSVLTSFIQEMRSYRAVDSLRKKTVLTVNVRRRRSHRDGHPAKPLSQMIMSLSSSPPTQSTIDFAGGEGAGSSSSPIIEAHELLGGDDDDDRPGHVQIGMRAIHNDGDHDDHDEEGGDDDESDVVELPIDALVPGDVVVLSSGDLVPADVRLLTHRNLLINQAALTGESVAVEKSTAQRAAWACDADNTLEWATCCLTGTSVETGTCVAVVVLTGDQTFFGMNAQMLAKTTPATAFDRGVKRISFTLMAFMLVMVPIVVVLNGSTTSDWYGAVFFGIAVAVGLTPEMLPMIVNTNLARAAVTLASHRVIAKRLQAVQNVGAMNILCTDKTGTLTEDHIVVEHSVRINAGGAPPLPHPDVLAAAGLVAHHVDGNRNTIDRAILDAFQTPGVDAAAAALVVAPEWIAYRDMFVRVGTIAFDFTRRRSSVVLRHTGQAAGDRNAVLICKGAVEEMLAVCIAFEQAPGEPSATHIAADGRSTSTTSGRRSSSIASSLRPAAHLADLGSPPSLAAAFSNSAGADGASINPLTPEARADVLQQVDEYLRSGYRVLLVAYRYLDLLVPVVPQETRGDNDDNDGAPFSAADEVGLVLRGMLILRDRPKASASTAINLLQDSFVSIKVLTGDNEIVAAQVCRDVGLDVHEHVVTGQRLAKLELKEKAEAIRDGTIFARLTPAQKAEVVQILQAQGNTVGFLGDGINDALALRQADAGMSVDSATEVARDAADLILLEKDLNVIYTAVVEGRRTHGNTIKYIKMAASSNFGNVFSVLVAAAWLPFLPMLPPQLLAQNLLYDFSQLAIPWDNMDESYLERPRPWDASSMISFMVCIGPISSVFDIGTFLFGWYYLEDRVVGTQLQSCWFTVGLMTQTLIVHAIRTEKIPFFQSIASPVVCLTSALIIVLAITIPYTPIGGVLQMVPPPPMFFAYLFSANICYFLLIQAVKMLYIRYFKTWM